MEKTMIEHVVERCLKSKKINQTIINTTVNFSDDKLVKIFHKNNWINKLTIYRGSETNVLDRTYQAALMSRADIIVRVMANNPFVDADIIDTMLDFMKTTTYDYLYLNHKHHFPEGFNCEIYTMNALKRIYDNAKDPYHLEHINTYIYNHIDDFSYYQYNLMNPNQLDFNIINYPNINFDKLTLGVNTLSDWQYVKRLFTTIYDKNPDFTFKDVLTFLNDNSGMIVYHHDRTHTDQNTLFYGKGQKLAIIAKGIIPNGVHDLSKSSDTKLPDIHPHYYTRASGIEIATMDGYKLKDFSTMASGSCILGYRDPDVDAAAHDSIERGNLTSLNNPNEVKLAELLVELHPWSSFAKFTKSESNALSLAVRIARCYTGKNKILIAGNSSWHDNFLATNLTPVLNPGKKHNDSHLSFDELSSRGVNSKLVDSATQIDLQNYPAVEKILIKEYQKIGAILMEPATDKPISQNTFNALQEFCNKNQILIIVNETKFGFRANTGGLHLIYNFTPDIAIFGRSISNGYSISAVIGNRRLMPAATTIYASDITWCDDIGINTAIETINKHKSKKIGNYIRSIGRYFQEKLEIIAEKYKIPIIISGLPSLTQFDFNYPINKDTNYDKYKEFGNKTCYSYGNLNNLMRTLYIQLMLQHQILADTLFYPSFVHTFKRTDYYLQHISIVFNIMKEHLDNRTIHTILLSQPAKKSYQMIT